MPKGRFNRLAPKVATLRGGAVPALKSGDVRLRGSGLQARNLRLMRKNPLCVECAKVGRVAPVANWDHIVPLWEGGHDVEANLQGLCLDCHDAKSAEETLRRTSGGAK